MSVKILKSYQSHFLAAKMTHLATKNKKTGAKFEASVRKALNNLGQFVYVKGVSSKGIDIFALKDDKALFIELKSHAVIETTFKNDALIQFCVNSKIVNDYINKTCKSSQNVLYLLVMYERNNTFYVYDSNDCERVYSKQPRVNIVSSIESIFINEFNIYFKTL